VFSANRRLAATINSGVSIEVVRRLGHASAETHQVPFRRRTYRRTSRALG
jgi:hypothetical protein